MYIYTCVCTFMYTNVYIFDIELCQISDRTSQTSDLAPKGENRATVTSNPVGLWYNPCGTQLAAGLKPLRLPRAQLQVIFGKRATNYRAL